MKKIIVEIRSSKNLAAVGRFSISKAFGLIPLILKTWIRWLRHRPSVLYYTAGSGAWVPFIRDFAFLTLCRPLFRKTLIHYHSGNLVEFLAASKFRAALGRFIYGRGAWTIRLGEFCPAPTYPGNKVIEIPNGLDAPANLPELQPSSSFRILFLGNLFEEKGVVDLLQAVHLFAERHDGPIKLSLVGGWPNESIQKKIENLISALPAHVDCPPPAPAYDAQKWQALASHDLFAFPTYYSSENFPLVVIEAMAASLPVLATDWRGLKSLVNHDVTGLLVPPQNVPALAAGIEKMAADPTKRLSMGAAGKLFYEHHLTARNHLKLMRETLLAATRD